MVELVERYRMDTAHLLQAEADIQRIPQQTLKDLAGTQRLEDVIDRLQQGELFYCDSHPQKPYCVYFRGKHYLNPAIRTVASPLAIKQLRSRYAFITIIDNEEPPAQIQHGGLTRQYYSSSQPLAAQAEPLPEYTQVQETLKTIDIQVEVHYDLVLKQHWSDSCQLWSVDDNGANYQTSVNLRNKALVKHEPHVITVTFRDVIPKHYYSCVVDQSDGHTIKLFQHLLITEDMAIPRH